MGQGLDFVFKGARLGSVLKESQENGDLRLKLNFKAGIGPESYELRLENEGWRRENSLTHSRRKLQIIKTDEEQGQQPKS